MAATIVLAGAPLLWSACVDNAWNDHYGVTEGGMADQATLLERIKADDDLANFYRVVTEINGSETLNSPQQLTVWAPKSLTAAQADSIIAIYKNDESKGVKWEDNKAITQFFHNHVALYVRTVSSLTNDTVTMLNNKYMHLTGTSKTEGALNGNPFHEALLCNNGMLYKTEHIQNFFPNVREFLEQTADMDSLANLILSFDEYELDEQASVAGGVVDGKTIYLDSVMNLSNVLLSSLGYIQREDSTYTLVVPTNEVWKNEYDKYRKYFKYDPTVANSDSLADIQSKMCIAQGRFFNTSANNRYNRHPEDSLVNTVYYERQAHNPRQNVYYKPYETILNGLERVECSNGEVYIDNKGVIDPRTTFFGRSDIPAYYSFYYDIPTNSSNVETMNVSPRTYQDYTFDEEGNSTAGKPYSYIEVTAKTSSSQTSLEYTLPSTLSGTYYNIYLVTVPDVQTHLPCWFQVSYKEKNDRGAFPSSSNYYTNPHQITADSEVDNADVILTQSNNQRCYVASAEKVDTILIQSAVQFNYSSWGVDEGVVKLTIGSFGPSNGNQREKIYTRTLRLNEIILVPFETKEEAEEAADDIDAFNDELLEANKEN